MSGKKQMVKVFGSIAVAASIAVVGARTAHAQTFITDTLGGNGHAQVASVQGYRFITDTLGGNGHAYNRGAYVYGGASQQVAQAIQSVGKTPSPVSSSLVARSTGSGIGWNDAWIPGVWAAGLLLLAGAAVMRSRQRRLAMA
jgi:MYXO-CTERM domain-containing protein